jgi:hypothetical protein
VPAAAAETGRERGASATCPRPEHVAAALFAELRPIELRDYRLERFGEPHDGGCLLGANLLGAVGSGSERTDGARLRA